MSKIIGNTVGTTMNPEKVASIGQKTKLSEFNNDVGFVNQQYVDNLVGDIASALEEILGIEDELIARGFPDFELPGDIVKGVTPSDEQ